MCLMVYIAAHGALRKVDWVEAAPAFYVADLSPDERRVDSQFRTGNVVYAGSYEGCGCGFQYGEYPAESYEPGEFRQRRDSLDAFAKYLRAELSRVGTIEVFACWDGDQGLEPVHHRTLTPAALGAGRPSECAVRSPKDCEAGSGCHAGVCTGPGNCSSYSDESSCNVRSACAWQSAGCQWTSHCSGTVPPCSAYSMTDCANVAGCAVSVSPWPGPMRVGRTARFAARVHERV